MNSKEYLNEENCQKYNRKINKVGNFLFCIGLIMIIAGITIIILALTIWKNPMIMAGGALLLIFGFVCFGFGVQAKFIGNIRNITSYMLQQNMPIAKESVEKMAPYAGITAKEITKGIKQGLKESEDEK